MAARHLLHPILAVAAFILVPIALAQTPAASPAPAADAKPLVFSVVSIKPHGSAPPGLEGCNIDGCHLVDRPLGAFIMLAYNLTPKYILGGPSWENSDRFDLDAKIDPADLPAAPLSSSRLAEMLQPVLADRFQLRVHHETRTLPVYNIVLAKGGLKMKESAPPAPAAPGSPASRTGTPPGSCYHTSVGNGLRVERNCAMNDVTIILESPTGRVVVDKTGLTGHYDFELHWTPDNTPADSPLAGGPSIFTAVQEQLGLS